MLLFRSEEHLDRWNERRGAEPGGILDPAQGWELASAWYSDRLSPSWRPRRPEEAQALFESIGLTGRFWQLEPDVSSQGGPDTPGA